MLADEFMRKFPGLAYCPDPSVPLTREQLNQLFAGNQQLFVKHLSVLTNKNTAKALLPAESGTANG